MIPFDTSASHPPIRPSLPAAAILALALAACSPEAEEKTYEVGAEDVGGGELQVADPQPGDVEVDLPETPMKNVPAEDTGTTGEAQDEAGEAPEPAR